MASLLLVPSQVSNCDRSSRNKTSANTSSGAPEEDRKKRKSGNEKKRLQNKRGQHRVNFIKPNVWCFIPECHLRAHPSYQELPAPEAILELESYASFSRFRQSSRQWRVMHEGRLTTSIAAGALGILEPVAAGKLGIPMSLSGNSKARHAFFHLQSSPSFMSLEAARVQLVDSNHDNKEAVLLQPEELVDEGVWESPTQADRSRGWNMSYAATREYLGKSKDRMAYGNLQEATAVLIAVNHFSKHNCTIQECGMFSGEALLECRGTFSIAPMIEKQFDILGELYAVGCPIGASPDGIIVSNDLKVVQTLEVKNHLFLNASALASFQSISPWYVPQMQLEMAMVGPHCKSAILVRLSSTKGAVIMKMKRDDEYILMMFQHFLNFYKQFVCRGLVPPENFNHSEEFQKLVKRTKQIAARSLMIRRLSARQVQRSPSFWKCSNPVKSKSNTHHVVVDW
jgi:hypothetical protein